VSHDDIGKGVEGQQAHAVWAQNVHTAPEQGECKYVAVLPLHHLLALNNENRWTDVLAVLVETDPMAASVALGLDPPLRSPTVRREAVEGGGSRLDLLVCEGDRTRVVVEAKVLSGLHRAQLRRYRERRSDAERYLIVYLARLPVHVLPESGWSTLTWESLLEGFANSTDAWVARTATAWRSYLDIAIPTVDEHTRWNDLRGGEDFVVAMRARMSWVFEHLDTPKGVQRGLAGSSAGVSWVCKMDLRAKAPGYLIRVEAEESLPVQDFPKRFSPGSRTPRGPSVRVCLAQTGVDTSSGFDWDYLLRLWPVMAAARSDWVTKHARPKADHDKVGHRRIIAQGAPAHLGIGFGNWQARHTHECWFGARLQLAPEPTLAQVVAELEATAELMLAMAEVDPAEPIAGMRQV